MNVVVDPASPVPPFEQLRAQLAALIVGGELEAGTRLPSIRQLAADLGLAAGTVARAFQELEAADLVETGGARGTRVSAHVDSQADARRAADEYVAAVRADGLDLATALALIRARYG